MSGIIYHKTYEAIETENDKMSSLVLLVSFIKPQHWRGFFSVVSEMQRKVLSRTLLLLLDCVYQIKISKYIKKKLFCYFLLEISAALLE